MRDIKIHFVCRGGVLRSRIAEMYATTHALPSIQVSSSGIEAAKYYSDETYLAPQAAYIAKVHGLSVLTSPKRSQTTAALLEKSDLIVFLSTDVYITAQEKFTLNLHKCVVWDVIDWDAAAAKYRLTQGAASSEIIIEEMYQMITQKLTRLLVRITESDWVDIVDETNKTLGFRLPIAWADKYGLWHRGCHAVITTADKRYIVEKRARRRRFTAGYLDISVCGIASSGENPEQAILREVEKELGLTAIAAPLQLLAVYKWHHYHPRYRMHKNMFIYTYHIQLPVSRPEFIFQKNEVATIRFLNTPRLRRLLRRNQLRPFGKLQYAYAYYASMVQLTEELEMAAVPSDQPS